MFGLFKKTRRVVVSPVKGKCIPIEEVHDDTFAQKMMGHGFAIIPSAEVIVSPVDGEIVSIAITKHAVGIQTKDKEDVMVHVGIDTVKLDGVGFTFLQEKGRRVKAGTPLLRFDSVIMDEKEIDMTTIVIFIDCQEDKINSSNYGKEVEAGEALIY